MTIVEVLAVLAVTVVIAAISLPALRGARTSSQDAASLANLQQHGTVFASYSAEWKDAFPYFIDPVDRRSTIQVESADLTVSDVPYFMSFLYWRFALADAYYDGNYNGAVFAHPGVGRPRPGLEESLFVSYYAYSCTFIAAPEYWAGATRTAEYSQLVATRVSDVMYSSSKVLLFEPHPALQSGGRWPAGLLLVDGSTRRHSLDRLNRGELGDGVPPPPAQEGHPSAYPPTMHTTHGVRGRDLR